MKYTIQDAVYHIKDKTEVKVGDTVVSFEVMEKMFQVAVELKKACGYNLAFCITDTGLIILEGVNLNFEI